MVDEKDTVNRIKVSSIKFQSLSIKAEMSKKQQDIQKHGDIGQGENLVEAKRREQAKQQFDIKQRSNSKGSNGKYSSPTTSPKK